LRRPRLIQGCNAEREGGMDGWREGGRKEGWEGKEGRKDHI